jgi:hypothetical protein
MTSSHPLGRRGIDWELHASGCWLWLKGKNSAGYPHGYAHRRYWEAVNGPRPDGHDIHHTCKTPACVNPEHLEAVDRREHDVLHLLTERTGLTIDDIRAIRELGRQQGVRAEDVARQYGVHPITISEWWSAGHWSDLLGETDAAVPERTCPHCATVFSDKQRQAVYCSKRCQQAAWAHRKAKERLHGA